jgi:5-methyltetrahydrofolate--homocysteine methyltransferase
MPMFTPTLETPAEAGLRDSVKIFVGDAPVTQEYADVGRADGYAPAAGALVRKLKRQLGIG